MSQRSVEILLGKLLTDEGFRRSFFPARASGVRYTAAVRPARALLGDRVVAVLSATATDDSVEVVTFDDPTLALKIYRPQVDVDSQFAFPNRKVAQTGDRFVRYSGGPKRQRLRHGQHLERTVDLLDTFPETILAAGDFVFSYEIGDTPVTQSPAAKLTIESGPGAVPNLFGVLAGASAGIRTAAASLLHRMTAHVVGYDPEGEPGAREQAIERWRRWWQTVGSKLTWSFTAPGAVFEGAPEVRTPRGSVAPAPRSQRSKLLGGVTYERRRLDGGGGKAMAGALGTWNRDPAKGAAPLSGTVWVADRLFAYPPERFLVDPGEEAAAALDLALRHLADLAAPGAPERPEAAILLATVARMPQARFVESLSALELRARDNAAWRGTLTFARGLLEVLGTD